MEHEISYLHFLPGINCRVVARVQAKIGPFFIRNIKILRRRQGLVVRFPTNFRPDLSDREDLETQILGKYRTIKTATKDFEKVRAFQS